MVHSLPIVLTEPPETLAVEDRCLGDVGAIASGASSESFNQDGSISRQFSVFQFLLVWISGIPCRCLGKVNEVESAVVLCSNNLDQPLILAGSAGCS